MDWVCLSGQEEWKDTKITFSLVQKQHFTVLSFAHSGWRSAGETFNRSSFDWTRFLVNLRFLVEKSSEGSERFR